MRKIEETTKYLKLKATGQERNNRPWKTKNEKNKPETYIKYL